MAAFEDLFKAIRESKVFTSDLSIETTYQQIVAQGNDPRRLVTVRMNNRRRRPQRESPNHGDQTMGIYLSAEDYLVDLTDISVADSLESMDAFARSLIQQVPKLAMIRILSLFNHFAHKPEDGVQWQNIYREKLSREVQARLDRAMSQADLDAPLFFGRQAVLRAMTLVLENEDFAEETDPDPEQILFLATVLCHVVASTLTKDLPEFIPSVNHDVLDLPEETFMYFIQNSMFNRDRDWYLELATHDQLWENKSPQVLVRGRDLTPGQLVEHMLRISPRDIYALGLGLYAHAHSRTIASPGGLHRGFNSAMDPEKIESFVGLVAASLTEHTKLAQSGGETVWDYLNFQQHPVLLDGEKLLVLDETYLLDVLTRGIYWHIHDQEKRERGSTGRDQWAEAYGEHVELLSEHVLRKASPKLLGESPRLAMYDETEFPFPGKGKVCDVTIELGHAYVLVEIVSGRPTTLTRLQGNYQSFQQDVKKLVIDKAEQLHDSAMRILAKWQPPLGITQKFQIRPVVVSGDEFPHLILSYRYIEAIIEEQQLLRDERIAPLAILDLLDLQLIGGLTELGHSPWEIVHAWNTSEWKHYPFTHYLRIRHPEMHKQAIRSSDVEFRAKGLFSDVLSRLDLNS